MTENQKGSAENNLEVNPDKESTKIEEDSLIEDNLSETNDLNSDVLTDDLRAS